MDARNERWLRWYLAGTSVAAVAYWVSLATVSLYLVTRITVWFTNTLILQGVALLVGLLAAIPGLLYFNLVLPRSGTEESKLSTAFMAFNVAVLFLCAVSLALNLMSQARPGLWLTLGVYLTCVAWIEMVIIVRIGWRLLQLRRRRRTGGYVMTMAPEEKPLRRR